MKTDLSTKDLVAKVKTQATQKRDYLVDASTLSLTSDFNKSYLDVNGKPYLLRERAERQLATLCEIPYNYFQKLSKRYPDLLDQTVNTIIANDGSKRLVDTFIDKVIVHSNRIEIKLDAAPFLANSHYSKMTKVIER